MFLRSRNLSLTFLLIYRVQVTTKIQVNSQFMRYWWFCLWKNFKFLQYWCFWGQGILNWHSYLVWLTSKIWINFRFKSYGWLCHMVFQNIFTIYFFMVRKSFADISNELFCLGTSKIQNNFRFPRFSRSPIQFCSIRVSQQWIPWSRPGISKSPKHGSSVGLPEINSLTSKTWIEKKLGKFIRQNHQYLWKSF